MDICSKDYHLVTISGDLSVRLWNFPEQKLIKILYKGEMPNIFLHMSNSVKILNDKLIMACPQLSKINFWKLKDGKSLDSFSEDKDSSKVFHFLKEKAVFILYF